MKLLMGGLGGLGGLGRMGGLGGLRRLRRLRRLRVRAKASECMELGMWGQGGNLWVELVC